jgi:hypothetical protein
MIISMKNPNDTIGNRARDLPACGTVSQLTAPQRASKILDRQVFIMPVHSYQFPRRHVHFTLMAVSAWSLTWHHIICITLCPRIMEHKQIHWTLNACVLCCKCVTRYYSTAVVWGIYCSTNVNMYAVCNKTLWPSCALTLWSPYKQHNSSYYSL